MSLLLYKVTYSKIMQIMTWTSLRGGACSDYSEKNSYLRVYKFTYVNKNNKYKEVSFSFSLQSLFIITSEDFKHN